MNDVELDTTLEGSLAEAAAWVGPDAFLEAPLVAFDARCFPDPWEASLQGVRRALQRFMRHLLLPDVPVVVHDGRDPLLQEAGPVGNPVTFTGIEDGCAHFVVFAINAPHHLAAWLALEVVRAWAEYSGLTRDEPLAYRAAPEPSEEDLLREHSEAIDDLHASVLGVALGLGPVIAAGSIQSHKTEQINGGWVQTRWSQDVVGGMPPPVLARLLAMHAVSREATPPELDVVRSAFDADLRSEFDATWAALREEGPSVRERLGLPDEVRERRAIDDAPLPQGEEVDLREAEEAFAEHRRQFNRGRRVYRVIHRHTWLGMTAGLALGGVAAGMTLGLGTPLMLGLGLGAAVGGGLGRSQQFYRCSDPDCGGRITLDLATCPACEGTVSGTLARAADRLAAEERDEAERE